MSTERHLTTAEVAAMTEEWPKSWAYSKSDEPLGAEMVVVMREFMRHLEGKGLTRRTLRGHLDNLWLLGGEIIRRMQNAEPSRQQSARSVLRDATEGGDAILIHGMSEAQQYSVDRTARRLNRYLATAR